VGQIKCALFLALLGAEFGVQVIPNTLNICAPGVVGDEVLARAPGVAASTGSACHTGQTEPSSVLLAMGIEPVLAFGALRLSLGRWTTADEIDGAVETLSADILALRAEV
jgi:cysteine desulfurase